MFTSVHLNYIHYTLISLSIYRIVLKNKIQVHCYTLMTEGEISSLFSLSRKHKHELYCVYQLKRGQATNWRKKMHTLLTDTSVKRLLSKNIQRTLKSQQ